MKLKHECVRDVLLTSEEETGLNDILQNEDIYEAPRLKKYEEEDVIYTIKKLKEVNYINAKVLVHADGNMASMKNLTYEGHLFLDNIRDESIWNKAKEQAKKISSGVSISVISGIALSILENQYKS